MRDGFIFKCETCFPLMFGERLSIFILIVEWCFQIIIKSFLNITKSFYPQHFTKESFHFIVSVCTILGRLLERIDFTLERFFLTSRMWFSCFLVHFLSHTFFFEKEELTTIFPCDWYNFPFTSLPFDHPKYEKGNKYLS